MSVSVVIPMYNSAGTIIRCLDSVINQTYKGELEVIVINDGSKDTGPDLLKEYMARNPDLNIKVFSQVNKGVSAARNLGMRKATSDYIAFLDADDYWLENKLDFQLKFFNDDVDFVCALRNNDTIGFPYKIKNGAAIMTLDKLLMKVVGQTSTAIFKRKILDNTGYFDENQKYSEDANYWMRIAIGNKMIILDKKLVITENEYAQSGLSSNLRKMEEGVQKNINEMYELGKISFLHFHFFKLFSYLKYMRRLNKIKNV